MSDDLISRQAAIAFVKSIPYIKEHQNMGELIQEWIKQIPGVKPVQKTGRWIDGYKRQSCSVCRYRGMRSWDFCPNCGAKMESEDQNDT